MQSMKEGRRRATDEETLIIPNETIEVTFSSDPYAYMAMEATRRA